MGTCAAQASNTYTQAGGNPAKWTATDEANVMDIKTGFCSGVTTQMVYSQSSSVIYQFATACSTLSTTELTSTVTSYFSTVDSLLQVNLVADPYNDLTGSCTFEFQIMLAASALPASNLSSIAAAHTPTVTVTSGTRRSSSTSTTSASQTVSECSSDCSVTTAAPTTAPDEDSSFPDWAIAVTVVIGTLVIVAIVIGLVMWGTRSDSRSIGEHSTGEESFSSKMLDTMDTNPRTDVESQEPLNTAGVPITESEPYRRISPA